MEAILTSIASTPTIATNMDNFGHTAVNLFFAFLGLQCLGGGLVWAFMYGTMVFADMEITLGEHILHGGGSAALILIGFVGLMSLGAFYYALVFLGVGSYLVVTSLLGNQGVIGATSTFTVVFGSLLVLSGCALWWVSNLVSNN